MHTHTHTQTQTHTQIPPREQVSAPRNEELLFLLLAGARPLAGGARHSLHGVDEVVFGRGRARAFAQRGTALHVELPDPLVSSKHARLTREGGKYRVVDEGSRNGLWTSAGRVSAVLLSEGDWFQIGSTVLMARTAVVSDELVALVESSTLAGRAYGFATLVPEYAEQLTAVAVVAASELSILLLGESGTGKEVLAQGIHRMSARTGPLVAVNCGALPPNLIEAQLFGHAKGAFTGAVKDEPGFVVRAHEGTLFLDEVGELTAPAQAALLRFLETKEVVAVGSSRVQRVDVRILSATLKPAAALRPDLVARLSGYVHRLAPLRSRIEDLGLLVSELLPRGAPALAPNASLAPDACRRLVSYAWPMNVRELLQALTSGALLAASTGSSAIEARHLPLHLKEPDAASEAHARSSLTGPLVIKPARRLLGQQQEQLVALLGRHDGNVTKVARDLGITRTQVHRWIEKLHLDLNSFRGAGRPSRE